MLTYTILGIIIHIILTINIFSKGTIRIIILAPLEQYCHNSKLLFEKNRYDI